jgi:hypothetical protein
MKINMTMSLHQSKLAALPMKSASVWRLKFSVPLLNTISLLQAGWVQLSATQWKISIG